MADSEVTEAANECWPREVFSASEVSVGDVIDYPAILRPEHHGERSRLTVIAIDGRTIRTDGGAVTPLQVEENGVLVAPRAAPELRPPSASDEGVGVGNEPGSGAA